MKTNQAPSIIHPPLLERLEPRIVRFSRFRSVFFAFAFFVGSILASNALRAATYTVTSSSDSGPNSLRRAILDANANPGSDNINFNLGSNITRIELTFELPAITDTVGIDGTLPNGEPGVELNGRSLLGTFSDTPQSPGRVCPAQQPPACVDGTDLSQCVSCSRAAGLILRDHTGSTVRGMNIHSFTKSGIWIDGGGGHQISGNWIGTDNTGLNPGEAPQGDFPNAAGGRGIWSGVNVLNAMDVVIGSPPGTNDPADRNVISFNGYAGIELWQSLNTSIHNNYIGLYKDGKTHPTSDFNARIHSGNLLFGIAVLNASDNTMVIGNTIADSVRQGILVSENVADTLIMENLLYQNGWGDFHFDDAGGRTATTITDNRFGVGRADVTSPGNPIVATSGNSPGREGVENAIDNDFLTKYLNFDAGVNSGDQVTGLTVTASESIVTGIRFTSANDAPERDPATYELSGSNDGGATFTLISEGDVPAFGTRFERREVGFENTVSYITYQLLFPMTVGPNQNSMQIAEIELIAESTDVGPVEPEITDDASGDAGTPLAEITDDFSEPLASEWLMYAPLGAFLEEPPTVESADGVLTLSHPPSPFPEYAPVIGTRRSDVNWSEFEVSVEFSGWTAGDSASTGVWLHARGHDGPDGLANSYFLAISTSGMGERVAGTQYYTTAAMSFEFGLHGAGTGRSLASMNIPDLDPAKWYRAVFKGGPNDEYVPDWLEGREALLEAWLYEVGRPEPIGRLGSRIPEQAYFSGDIGFGIWDHAAWTGVANNGVTMKFDNFVATGTPVTRISEPSLTIERSIRLSWPAASAPAILESAAGLDGPWEAVSAVPPPILGDQFQVTVPAENNEQFFRLNMQ